MDISNQKFQFLYVIGFVKKDHIPHWKYMCFKEMHSKTVCAIKLYVGVS